MIFSNCERTEISPRRYSEPIFTHLDRSARLEFARIRQLIDAWFSHLPETCQTDVQARIRSGNDRAFHSAFLEIYIHELLTTTGHLVAVHPELPHTSKRPDFLATAIDSSATIFEAVVATETSAKEIGDSARLNALYDAIQERIRSPDHYLGLDIEGSPNTPIPLTDWCRQIQSWVGSLNYDHIVAIGQRGGFDQLPSLELLHDGLIVTVEPIAKKKSARGNPGIRPLGAQSFEGCWITSHLEIAKSVSKKATRYGDLAQPYIVVVNCIGEHCDLEEIDEAMYGNQGLWSSVTHPTFRRLSAVLAVHHLFPWSASRAGVRLFHNPHANYPYTGTFTELPQAVSVAGKIQKSNGTNPEIYFGLSETWPCQP
jgi:hypothetical protein